MLLILIGFCVGTIGTMIGVGGGFVLVPILLFMYPNVSNVWISSVSMFVVAMNATSGSITYYFKDRVHVRAAFAFILASFPGSFLGVWIERFVTRSTFELIFGAAIMIFAIVLLLRKSRDGENHGFHARAKMPAHYYWRGCWISFFVGFVASFFGIGGGVIHVPLLSHVLGFPVHLAAGTSHAILAVTAWFTTALHLMNGDIKLSDPVLWELGISAVVGAQVGARLSAKVSGNIILKILAVALFSVGARLVWPALHLN